MHGRFGKVSNYKVIDFKDYPLYLDVEARQRLLDEVLACDKEYLFLISSRKRFIQGADPREFHLPDSYPDMREVLAEFDKSKSVIVTVLRGDAHGLGFEIALASDYRVATMDVHCSFPEVKIGLIPGSGGTVRLPRIAHNQNYASLIINSGNKVSAIELWNQGVIDYLYASNTSNTNIIGDILALNLEQRKMTGIEAEIREERAMFKKLRDQKYRS